MHWLYLAQKGFELFLISKLSKLILKLQRLFNLTTKVIFLFYFIASLANLVLFALFFV